MFASQNFHIKLSVISKKKKLTTENMLRTVRKVADAKNGSAFLNMEFNVSAKLTKKASLVKKIFAKMQKIFR